MDVERHPVRRSGGDSPSRSSSPGRRRSLALRRSTVTVADPARTTSRTSRSVLTCSEGPPPRPLSPDRAEDERQHEQAERPSDPAVSERVGPVRGLDPSRTRVRSGERDPVRLPPRPARGDYGAGADRGLPAPRRSCMKSRAPMVSIGARNLRRVSLDFVCSSCGWFGFRLLHPVARLRPTLDLLLGAHGMIAAAQVRPIRGSTDFGADLPQSSRSASRPCARPVADNDMIRPYEFLG